ncbi:site-2 protease family protein [Prosthecobacter sp.]|uniref:site-2 protease family protein n=1 Tax=Prosthecobacter sp. TaxID=1965333 RepID=UPI003782F699
MMLLGYFVVYVLILTLVFNVATVLLCRRLRVGVTEFGVFYGPKLARWQVGGCEVSLGLLPTGGFVGVDQVAMKRFPVGARVLMAGIGPLATASVGLLLLGEEGFKHFLTSALAHLGPGTLHPLTVGVDCVARVAVMAELSFWRGLGVMAAVNTALALLPLTPMPMYRVLATICGRGMTEKEEGKDGMTLVQMLEVAGAMLVFVAGLLWGLAVVVFFWRLVMWEGG